jgi:hypothetical protein
MLPPCGENSIIPKPKAMPIRKIGINTNPILTLKDLHNQM